VFNLFDFLNYFFNVKRTKKDTLPDLPSAPPSHCQISWPLYFPQSKMDSRLTVITPIYVITSTRCGFWKIRKILKSLSPQSLSVITSIKTYFSTLYTTIPPCH